MPTNPTSGIAQSHKIGLSNLHVAKISKDDSTGVTYDTVLHIPEIVSLSIEPQNQTAELYGDNMSVDVANSTPSYNVTIELAGLPLEYKAYLLGHEFADGKISVSSDDVAPFVGIAFETLKSNGTKRYFKFLKVKFAEPNEQNETKGENINFQTSSLEGKAVFRTYDAKVYEQADEESGFADSSSWYTFPAIP